jgi:ElaB/YqjD/DUF883 family membrane-anchored ribosome-binding protein
MSTHSKEKDLDETTADAISETVSEINAKISDLSQSMVTYVKKNPIKAVGFSLLAGAILAQLVRSRK